MKEKSLLYPHTVPYIPLSPPQMPSLHLPVANMVRARMHAPSVFVCVSCTRRQQNTAPVRSDQRTMDDRGIMGEEEGKKTIMEVCSKGGVERSIRPTASRQKKKKKRWREGCRRRCTCLQGVDGAAPRLPGCNYDRMVSD